MLCHVFVAVSMCTNICVQRMCVLCVIARCKACASAAIGGPVSARPSTGSRRRGGGGGGGGGGRARACAGAREKGPRQHMLLARARARGEDGPHALRWFVHRAHHHHRHPHRHHMRGCFLVVAASTPPPRHADQPLVMDGRMAKNTSTKNEWVGLAKCGRNNSTTKPEPGGGGKWEGGKSPEHRGRVGAAPKQQNTGLYR